MPKLWDIAERIYLPATIIAAALIWLAIIIVTVTGVEPLSVLAGGEEEAPVAPGAAGVAGLQPTTTITLYAGELPGGRFGFGLSPDNITSPGPTIRVRVGEVVQITLINVGDVRHAFVITPQVVRTNPEVLFGAQIGSAARPLGSGEQGSVIFVATEPGEFFYQCPVANHGPKGMWGKIIVEG